jgi:hypothetical protein
MRTDENGDVIHGPEEFGLVPWREFDDEGHNWAIGYGGHGLPSDVMHIYFVHEDLHSDVWILPEPLATAMRYAELRGQESVREEVRASVGSLVRLCGRKPL